MVLPLFKERRLTVRKKLTGLLPGKMVNQKGEVVSLDPVDVSKQGLGVVSTEVLSLDDVLYLVLENTKVKFIVTWFQEDFTKKDLKRYGLMCEDENVDLEKIFMEYSCLK